MIGTEILNYRITALIGKGGMGSVYLAEHKLIETQKVAIKVINKDMLNDFTVGLLKSEAEHLASLNHPNIVHFIDYHVDEQGNVYLIMEYANGISLDKYVKTVTGLIVEDRIGPIFEPILDAVEYAHKKNIIHRDIKPQNIIITDEGTPKILDFGISQILHGGDDDENDNFVAGTPSYMSPEQVKGEKLDERSDIYSLGVMLHQLLTGTEPYDTSTLSVQDIEKKIIEEPLPPMRSYYKYVSDRIQKVVDKATAKNRDDRYRTCADFKRDFHKAVYPAKLPKWGKYAIAAGVAIVVFAIGFIWDYNRTKVEYYKDYVEVNGVPQGFGSLSTSDREHRNWSYRFTYTKHKLIEVAMVNSKDKVIEPSDGNIIEVHAAQQFTYTADGKVDYTKVLDHNGKVLYIKDFNPELSVVTFRYDDEKGTEKNLEANVTDLLGSESNDAGKSRISRYLITRHEDGRVAKIEYASFQNQRVSDGAGIFGREYVYDEKGRTIEEHFLGYDGKLKANKNGLAIRTVAYNDDDNLYECLYLTADRKAAGNDEDKAPKITFTHDKWGNAVEMQYLDLDGNPINSASSQYSKAVMTYENGSRTLVKFIGTDGKPCISNEGIAGFKSEFDENGFTSLIVGIDENEKPHATTLGYAGYKTENDEFGNPLKQTYIDENLNPTFDPTGGYSICYTKYDERGNVIEMDVRDEDDNPVMASSGFSKITLEFDKYDRMVKREFFGIDGKHTGGNDGFSYQTLEYDIAGNLVKSSYFDSTGANLQACNYGYCGWTSKFNEQGCETERVYFNQNNQPVNINEGNASYRVEYDERGNATALRYYNSAGNMCFVKEDNVNIAGWIKKYDERGNILSSYYLGTDNKPLSGYLTARYKYDSRDNVIETAYYNGESKAINNANIHRITSKYNNRNQITESSCYDIAGNPVMSSNGFSSIRYVYDNRGNEIEQSFYDTKGNITTCTSDFAKEKKDYDNMNRLTRERFYDTSDAIVSADIHVPEISYKYDKWGNVCELTYCDGKGKPSNVSGTTFSIIKSVYRGSTMLEQAYFDENDKPVLNSSNYHKEVHTYNKLYQLTDMQIFDTAGNPIDCASGFQKVEVLYDKENRNAYRRYITASGRVIYKERWNGTEWVAFNGEIPADYAAEKEEPAQKQESTAPAEQPKDKGDKPAGNQTKDGKASDDDSGSVSASAVASIRSSLPRYLDAGGERLKMASISVKGNTITVTFTMERSMYDTTDDQIAAYKSAARTAIRGIKSHTKASRVVGNITDSRGRSVATVSA